MFDWEQCKSVRCKLCCYFFQSTKNPRSSLIALPSEFENVLNSTSDLLSMLEVVSKYVDEVVVIIVYRVTYDRKILTLML